MVSDKENHGDTMAQVKKKIITFWFYCDTELMNLNASADIITIFI